MEKQSNNKVGIRKRLIFIIVGLAGQFAWSIENMYLNTYIQYLNETSTIGFDYSLFIALTTAFSAIVATLTTILMGALTDKIGKRKLFISIGYILWGLSTASFGLFNVGSNTSLIMIPMTASTAGIMVIVMDCVMTFFGSTSNDAAFNSYVTQNTSDNNRAKVEGVLSILPLVAMLIIFVGLNGLTTKEAGYRWDLFFYILGGIVSLVGLTSIFLIPKEDEVKKENNEYIRLLLDGFSINTVKENKLLYLVLLAYFIYGVSCQVYFPYLMIYVEKTCSIANSGSSFLTPFAIVMAISLLLGSAGSVGIGFISDKIGKNKMIIPTLAIFGLGLLMMFANKFISNDTARTIYSSISGLVMILGYVAVPTILNSYVRELIPKGREGSFMGVRMIFVVALPMVIGPFIGDALNKTTGDTYLNEFNVQSPLPSEWNYVVAFGLLLISIIPVIFIIKELNKRNQSIEAINDGKAQ